MYSPPEAPEKSGVDEITNAIPKLEPPMVFRGVIENTKVVEKQREHVGIVSNIVY
jgi:hypothetical protein